MAGVSIALGAIYGLPTIAAICKAYFERGRRCIFGYKTLTVQMRSLDEASQRHFLKRLHCATDGKWTNTLEYSMASRVVRKRELPPSLPVEAVAALGARRRETDELLSVLWKLMPNELVRFDVARGQHVVDLGNMVPQAALWARTKQCGKLEPECLRIATTEQRVAQFNRAFTTAAAAISDRGCVATMLSEMRTKILAELATAAWKIVVEALFQGYGAHDDKTTVAIPTSCITMEEEHPSKFKYSLAIDLATISHNSATCVFSTWGDIDTLCDVVCTWCSSAVPHDGTVAGCTDAAAAV